MLAIDVGSKGYLRFSGHGFIAMLQLMKQLCYIGICRRVLMSPHFKNDTHFLDIFLRHGAGYVFILLGLFGGGVALYV